MEAFLAIMIVFTFVIFFLPRDYRYPEDQSNFLLKNLEKNEDFRNCVLARNETCIENIIDELFEGRFFFDFTIYRFAEPDMDLNLANVMVYTWFFAGNSTIYDPTTFKLYYWDRVVAGAGFNYGRLGSAYLIEGPDDGTPPSPPEPEPEPDPPEPDPPEPESSFVYLLNNGNFTQGIDGLDYWTVMELDLSESENSIIERVENSDFSSGYAGRVYGVGNEPGPAGENWTEVQSSGESIMSIYHSDGVWIAGSLNGYIYRSTDDGETWTTVQSSGEQIRSVYYGNGVWIAAGGNGNVYRSINNGLTWSNPKTSGNWIYSVYFGYNSPPGPTSGIWVAGAQDGRIYRSNNHGSSWNSMGTLGETILSVYYGDDIWVAGAQNGHIYRSADAGLTWTEVQSSGQQIHSVYYGDGIWIAGAMSGRIYRSADAGLAWDEVQSSGQNINSVYYGDGVWVAGASNGRIYRSTDVGLTWDEVQSSGSNIMSVYNANDVWVAGALGGRIYRSSIEATDVEFWVGNSFELENENLDVYVNLDISSITVSGTATVRVGISPLDGEGNLILGSFAELASDLSWNEEISTLFTPDSEDGSSYVFIIQIYASDDSSYGEIILGDIEVYQDLSD